MLCDGVLEGFLGQTGKKIKKHEKDYQHFGLRNAVYYEGWECVDINLVLWRKLVYFRCLKC